ncbi:MAG: hypothetical protein OXI69_05225 [Acidobacteriota bacterium]|nr:hypothetical protein [Acidobacteriota bacterium]
MPTIPAALSMGLGLALTLCRPAVAAEPPVCAGGQSIGQFRFLVQPAPKVRARPLAGVNRLEKGRKLLYIPVRQQSDRKRQASIALVLIAAGSSPEKEWVVLDPRPAAAATQWEVPFDVEVVAAVYGPRGLNVKKVKALVRNNEDVITQLADYAQQTAQVGALVEALAAWERSPDNSQPLDAVLQGFSARHNVSLPRIDPKAPADQQAALLLGTLLPSLATYDPLNPQPAHRIRQSAGLAASLATMFLGNSALLATGGVALFQNLRTLISPGTDFRSAFAQNVPPHDIQLCSQRRPAKGRARIAYLWALRVPSRGPPQVSVASDAHLPIAREALLRIWAEDASDWRQLPRAHDWKLIQAGSSRQFAVGVALQPSLRALKLDTGKEVLPPGEYTLAASWDWEPFELTGRFRLHRLGDLTLARVTPQSQHRLVTKSGRVRIELTGADFQFVEKLELVKSNPLGQSTTPLAFLLSSRTPDGRQPQLAFALDTDGLASGHYGLKIFQADADPQVLPLQVHPPLPRLSNLPLKVNLGEESQRLLLEGSGLERIDGLESAKARWELAPLSPATQELERRGVMAYLENAAQQGDLLPITLRVTGMEAPVVLKEALQVVGRRPAVARANTSFPPKAGLGLREGEIPAGLPVSFAIEVERLLPLASLQLGCRSDGQFQSRLTLVPGQPQGVTRLDITGRDTLFLSLDPGSLSATDCSLAVVVRNETTGSSDPHPLGRVVRLPRIERFVLTGTKLGESLYEGILTGEELHHIVRAGWDESRGRPVAGIPTPFPDDPKKQTLRIALPWPSPEPHAPVFIWLRGEDRGRPTQVRY